jgi:hypothetical protein
MRNMDLASVSACGYPVSPTSSFEDAVFFPMYIFGPMSKNQMSVAVWGYFCFLFV